jgi:hypothetical protein
MSDPSTAVEVEGINYFADTLLFAGAILALAAATPRTDQNETSTHPCIGFSKAHGESTYPIMNLARIGPAIPKNQTTDQRRFRIAR